MEINGKVKKFEPRCPKIPEPMASKRGVNDNVGDTNPFTKFHRVFASRLRPVPARLGALRQAYKVTRLV